MELFLTEVIHLLAGLIVGSLLYYKYRQRRLFFLCLAVTIFIDLDHLIDYFLAVNFSRFDLIEFLDTNFVIKANKIYVLFHGWEFVFILLFLAGVIKKYRPVLLTMGLAIFGHLLVDQFTNGTWIFGYSLIYRLINNFSYNAFIGLWKKQKQPLSAWGWSAAL